MGEEGEEGKRPWPLVLPHGRQVHLKPMSGLRFEGACELRRTTLTISARLEKLPPLVTLALWSVHSFTGSVQPEVQAEYMLAR